MLRRAPSGEPIELLLSFDATTLPREKGSGQLPRKNVYWMMRRGMAGLTHTKLAKGFITAVHGEALRLGWDPAVVRVVKRRRVVEGTPPIRGGWWVLSVLQRTPTRNLSLDVLAPLLDSDACLSPVKDALALAGVIDNDARIVRDVTAAVLGELALWVRLVRVDWPGDLLGDWGVPYLNPR